MPDKMTVVISGREIPVSSAKFLRTMDTCADACTVTMPWEPGADTELDEATRPFGFQDAFIYIGSELQMQGILYDVTQTRDTGGTVKELEIYSKTADIIDSTVFPPYEANNISLTARCEQQAGIIGIQTIVAKGVDLTVTKRIKQVFPGKPLIRWEAVQLAWNVKSPEVKVDLPIVKFRTIREEFKFSRVTAKNTDTIFSHLSGLASQRGLLLSCTKYGDLLIIQPNLEDPPVGTIEEQTGLTNTYSASFKGRERFGYYRALANSASSTRAKSESRANDNTVTRPRFLTFNSSDNLPGEAFNAAVWRKNKTAADAMTLTFPVNSWRAPNGELWAPNTRVTVISPTIGLKKGFTFLINRVEFDYSSGGAVATLSLKPPTAYTTGEISEPWLSE